MAIEHVFLDACVLVPSRLRGVLLDLSHAGRFKPRWNETVLDEFERTLLGAGVTPTSMRWLRDSMAGNWPEACVTDWEHLVDDMGNHPKDRHVLAAAVHAEVPVVVTLNLRDFPVQICAHWGVQIQHPDEFLCRLFHDDPESTAAGVRSFADRLKRPPTSVEEVLGSLEWPGRNEFATLLRTWLDSPSTRG